MIPPSATADTVTGLVLVSAAAVAWVRRPESRVGPLIALTGVSWLAGDIWTALLYAHRGPLVHTLLTHPSGRTRSPLIAALVALAYIDGAVPALARSPWLTLALAAAVICAASWRCAVAHGVERKACAVPLVAAVGTCGTLGSAAIGQLSGADTGALAAWGYELAVAGTAIALAIDLVSGRPVRAAATGLVIDLGGAGHAPGGVRSAIARAVGDPELTIFYRADGHWVDEDGRLVPVPGGVVDKQVSTIDGDDGVPVAAIVHDVAALRDETLARPVAAAVRLAVANVRLQADVAARVQEVAESRRRLIEASDLERRRLREQLRSGAERRLAAVAVELQRLAGDRDAEAAAALGHLVTELDSAREDLARFAQGVHPQALTEHGLPGGLRTLAANAAVPVELEVPDERFPALQEAAAYFVCSEGLANVEKYAAASSARIAVAANGTRLRVQVRDDGTGGAAPAAGSGLRGLADRVEALGGRLIVESPVGAGTTLTAELPLGEAAR